MRRARARPRVRRARTRGRARARARTGALARSHPQTRARRRRRGRRASARARAEGAHHVQLTRAAQQCESQRRHCQTLSRPVPVKISDSAAPRREHGNPILWEISHLPPPRKAGCLQSSSSRRTRSKSLGGRVQCTVRRVSPSRPLATPILFFFPNLSPTQGVICQILPHSPTSIGGER